MYHTEQTLSNATEATDWIQITTLNLSKVGGKPILVGRYEQIA